MARDGSGRGRWPACSRMPLRCNCSTSLMRTGRGPSRRGSAFTCSRMWCDSNWMSRNAAAEVAPMGFGFHPAFAACAATTFRTGFDGVWSIDADSLPTSLAPANAVLPELPAAVHALRSELVDHCFTGWSRELVIDHAGDGGDTIVTLAASRGLEFLQLYTPPGKKWFCAEPMSQMPDAINRRVATGLRHLQPGESLQASMTIAVAGNSRSRRDAVWPRAPASRDRPRAAARSTDAPSCARNRLPASDASRHPRARRQGSGSPAC